MKNHRFLFLAFLFLIQKMTAFGQVLATEKVMSFGLRPALEVRFSGAKTKYVESVWATFSKEEFSAKPKWSRKKKEYQMLDVRGAGLGGEVAVDVYSKIEDEVSGTKFTVWIDLDADEFVSKSDRSSSFSAAEAMVERFEKRVLAQQKQDRVASEDKKLRDLETDLKKLQRENERLKKAIEDCKKKIAKAETDLLTNDAAQQKAATDIESQQKMLEKAQTEN